MENLELENVELEDIVAAEDQAASGDKETQAILTSCGSHSNAERKWECLEALLSLFGSNRLAGEN